MRVRTLSDWEVVLCVLCITLIECLILWRTEDPPHKEGVAYTFSGDARSTAPTGFYIGNRNDGGAWELRCASGLTLYHNDGGSVRCSQ